MNTKLISIAALVATATSGCITVTPPTSVQQPMSVRASQPAPVVHTAGSVYTPGYASGLLFEDRRARSIGDIITVQIVEKTDAQKSSNTNTARASNNTFGVSALAGLPGKSLLGSNLAANSDFSFDGKGASASANGFSGTITVTVTEVLPNGNLSVSGEKQVGINQGSEFIRLSGVVNPIQLTAGNTIQSIQLADARIEYRGSGSVDDNQKQGWLSRFFLNVLPF